MILLTKKKNPLRRLRSAQDNWVQRNDIFIWRPAVVSSCTAVLGFTVCVCVCCRGALCSLCPTVSKDWMRDLTVAPGSGSASPLASPGKVGVVPHQWRLPSESDTLTSPPWGLTDTINRVAVYGHIQCGRGERTIGGFCSHHSLFTRLPDKITWS